MSGRTIFSYSLAALLASVIASGGVAQYYPGTGPASAPIQASVSEACCATKSAKTGKLEGKWVRELQAREQLTYAIAATLSGDELKICLKQIVGDARLGVTLTAEYALSKDGLVHGIITGADLIQDPKAINAILSEGELGDFVRTLQNLVDCPFSFRARITSEGLMVSNVKLAVGEKEMKGFEVTKEVLALLGGMYKQSNDGSLPLTKARDAATGTNIANSQGQLAHPGDKNFLEQYYKTEFGTANRQSPPASPPPSAPTPAKALDIELPARMITLKECIAIALGQGIVGSELGDKLEKECIMFALKQGCVGSETRSDVSSKLMFPKIQPSAGILDQRIQLDIQINYLLANVEMAYWNLFAAYHNLYAQEEGLRQAYLGYRFTDTRVTIGTDPSCNRDQTRAQLERFRRMVLDARGQVAESERQLRGLLGLRSDDGKRLVPSDEPNSALTTPDFQAAANEALANRPEIQQCRQDLKVQQLNLALQMNLRRPDLRHFMQQYTFDGFGRLVATQCMDKAETAPGNAFKQLADNQCQNWTLILRTTMPLGLREANAEVREADLKVARSYYQLRDTELKVIEYLVQQYRQVIQTHADIAPARAEREALQNYIAKVKPLISEGKFKSEDFLNYLTVQQQLATAIATESQAIANFKNALATFEFAKGTIQKHHEVCISIAEDRLPTSVQKENVLEFKAVTAPVEEARAVLGSLAHAPVAGAVLGGALGATKVGNSPPPLAGVGSPSSPPQLTFSYSVPDRTVAPAPRKVTTPPLQLAVPAMTAPTLPPVEFPVELPH